MKAPSLPQADSSLFGLLSSLKMSDASFLYNKEENKAFCILDAPDEDAVEKSHQSLL
jgi:hypothetical protein